MDLLADRPGPRGNLQCSHALAG